jgi:hypothetical protein
MPYENAGACQGKEVYPVIIRESKANKKLP